MSAFETSTPVDGTPPSEAAAEATSLWEERGYRLYAWSGHYALALVAGNRGDRASCRACCDAMIEWAAPRQMGRLDDWANHALAQAALGAGGLRGGLRTRRRHHGPGTLTLAQPPGTVVRARPGRRRRAHRSRSPRPGRTRGAMRDADLGRVSHRGIALITAAAEAMTAPTTRALDALPTRPSPCPAPETWPFELARVQLAHGERLRRLRRTREARTQLVAARDGFDRLGAVPWSRRATTELAGDRRHPSDPRRGGAGLAHPAGARGAPSWPRAG